MKTSFWGKLTLVITCLLLVTGGLLAKTDTLGFIGARNKGDTSRKVPIFHKFTWNVAARYIGGKTATFISAEPDTLFRSGGIASVHLTTDFYVDTPALNNILTLHYVLEGSVKATMNGHDIVATGVFHKPGTTPDFIEDEFVDILFKDTIGRLDIMYLPYKTNEFTLSMSIYERQAAEMKIKDQVADDNESFSAGFYYLAFGVIFLILFAFFREKTENLYFSLFCLFASLAFLWKRLNTDVLYNLDPFFGIFCFEFLSIFFCKILANKEKSKIPLMIIVAAMAFCFLPFARYGVQYGLQNRAPWIVMSIIGLLYLYTWISSLYFLVQGIGQKRWEARAILIICFIPIVVFVLLIIVFIFVVIASIEKGFSFTYFTTLLSYFSTSIVYIYPLAAVFILAKRNGLNHVKLMAQVKSIQQLSEENLAKEVEKKEILEGQKESLEKEVAQRTEEIMSQKEKIEKQHDELKEEKKKSDDLLRNILPQEVADELKANGNTTAKHYDNVTVLFTDFVNFTRAGERMSPQGLIDELHSCFKAFDDITGKYGIEKIKTIGDAYLAVCGLPTSDTNHAENTVKAAIEINAFMADRMAKMGSEQTFHIRIGVHSGSVVAGIVGVKKFAYDIWGDTVNTAARMEQHGEAGKINISQTTYELVKDKFTCEYRGEIDAKGKGVMKMYFVA